MNAPTCPVLAFTPTVESALRWFERTHEETLLGANGPLVYRQVRLPGPGSVADQDAKLSEALALIRTTWNDILITDFKRSLPKHGKGQGNA